MTVSAIGEQLWNAQAWNGPSTLQNPAPDHAVLFNNTAIILNWTSIGGAVEYELQVSTFPDFKTLNIHTDTAVPESTKTFTDAGTNNLRRYWRVRPKNALGVFFEPFSEVASYWLDTGRAENVTIDRNEWVMFDEADVLDRYDFDLFPMYQVIPRNLNRIFTRNRLGELISEFLTIKDTIQLNFIADGFLEHTQMDEFQRFNNIKKTFFLATFKDGIKGRPFPHIWKVEFSEDPTLTMFVAGRPDILTGTLNFEEV